MTVILIKTKEEGRVVAQIVTEDAEVHIHDLGKDYLVEIT